MPIDRSKRQPSSSEISAALEGVSPERMKEIIEELTSKLTESTQINKEFLRSQRVFSNNCSCPNFCYFHTMYG